MASGSVTSAEVAIFLTNFAELENLCNNIPKDIINISSTNQSMLELCDKLYSIAAALHEAELSTPHAFSFPSNPEFQNKWRIYEEHYEKEIFWALLRSQHDEDIHVPKQSMNPTQLWQHANIVADVYSQRIQELFFLAASSPDKIDEIAEHFDLSKDDQNVTYLEAWHTLTEQCGLDPIQILRRRQLLPFILVPKRRDGDNLKTDKLLKSLEDAQRAFVFGATLASIVMMRSHMEAVLRDHYLTEGEDLEQLIDNTSNLPTGIFKARLHQIRLIANKIAHNGSDKPAHKQKPSDVWTQRMSEALYTSVNSPKKAIISGSRMKLFFYFAYYAD